MRRFFEDRLSLDLGTGLVGLEFADSLQPIDFRKTVDAGLTVSLAKPVEPLRMEGDDHGNDAGSATVLEEGVSVSGVLETGDDQDWFSFAVTAGTSVQFVVPADLDGAIAGYRIVDEFGADVPFTAGQNDNMEIVSTVDVGSTGLIYIVIEASGPSDIAYTVRAEAAQDDFGNTPDTAGTVPANGSIAGEIESSGDDDWFEVQLTGANTLLADFDNPDFGLQDVTLSLYDADGTRIARTQRDTFQSDPSFFADLGEGTYYLGVSAASGTGNYTVQTSTATDDFGSSRARAESYTFDTEVSGAIDYQGDRDVFTFTLVDSAQVSFNISDGGEQNVFLSVQNVDTFATNSGSGNFTAGLVAGTYTMTVEGINGPGSYTFSATGGEAAEDDTPGDASTPRVAEVNGDAVTGVIEFDGDADWFQISTVEGQTYEFSLEDTQLQDFDVRIVDADGNTVDELFVEQNFELTDTFVGFIASRTGDFFLSVSSVNYIDPVAYDFTISSDAVADDDFAADTSTTGVVVIDADGLSGALGGVLEREGDVDWFAFDGTQGQTVQFIGTPEIQFEIYDANGDVVTEGVRLTGGQIDPGMALFDIAQTGQYFISVSQAAGVVPIEYGASYAVVPSDETGAIAVDEVVTVFLSDSEDIDDYTITLEAGTEYYLSGQWNFADALLLNSDEMRIDTFDADSIFTVSETAEYTLRYATDIATGTFELFNIRLIEVPDDVNVTTTQAELEAGLLSFAHSDGDVDSFSFDLGGSSSRAFRIIPVGEDDGVTLSGVFDGLDGDLAVTGTLNGVRTIYFTDAVGANGRFSLTGDRVGEYKFRIEEIADDFVNSVETDSALAAGENGSVSGQIDFAGDTDWHSFTATEDAAYRFTTIGAEGSFLTDLLDANGNSIAADVSDTQTVFLQTGQTVYLAVSAAGSLTNGYTLSAEVVPDDHGNNAQGATAVAYGDMVTARTDYFTDRDAFTITADARDVIVLEFGDNFFFNYTIIGPNGDALGRPTIASGTAALQADVAGDYTIIINSSGGFSEGTVTNFTLSRRIDALTGGTDTVGRIEANSLQNGTYEFFGDVDAFSFTLTEGEDMLFQTLRGGVLRYEILDADGTLVQTGEDYANLTTDGLAAGEYFVVLNSFEDGSGFQGGYRIGAFSTIDDYDGLPGDANIGTVAVGGSVTAVLNPVEPIGDTVADQDAFTLSLAAGQSIVIAERSATGATIGTLLVGPDGIPLAANFDLNDNYTGPIVFTAETAGDYTVIGFGVQEGQTDLYSIDIFARTVGAETPDQIVGGTARDVIEGGAGDDTLFGDAARGVPANSFEAQLYRSYQAVFDRAPDAAGFEFFLDAMQLGIFSQEQVLVEFVGSQEFQDTYGELSNRAFVEQLYRNVLDREGDPDGVGAFTAALDGGATRAQVVLDFANSAEFIGTTGLGVAAFLNNVSLSPYEGQVYRAYQGVFGREPDLGGFDIFISALEVGLLDLQGIINDFTGSPEFQATYGELSNRDFVELLYTNVLPGNEDAVGRAAFTAALDAGDLTRAQVVLDFTESFAFQQATAADAVAFRNRIFENNTDVIYGGAGDDTMFGGRGVDVFVYANGTDGADTILDFTPGVDVIDIAQNSQNLPFIFDFEGLRQLMSQDGNDVLIDFGEGNTVRLVNVQLDALTVRDFVLQGGVADDYVFTSAEPPQSVDISKPDIAPVSEQPASEAPALDMVDATVTFDGLFWTVEDNALL